MAYNQAYSAYKTTGVKTATQGKLVVMLYDEAVKQLRTAIGYFDAENKVKTKDIEKLNKCIQKTQEIITELMVSLNMNEESCHDIAQNLLSLYVFFNRQLFEATMNQDRKPLDFVFKSMSELRDSFAKADTLTETHASGVGPSFSING